MAKKSNRGPLSGAELNTLAVRASKATGVPAPLIRAVIQQESGGNPTARSHAGAGGLMQLMPGTAAGLGVENVNDPWQNVLGGARYLAQQLEAFDGDVQLALSAYNSGPGGSESKGRIEAFPETQNYVKKVAAYEKQFRDTMAGATVAPVSGAISSAPEAPTMPQFKAPQTMEINYEGAPQSLVGAAGPMSAMAGSSAPPSSPSPGVVPLTPESALELGGGQPPQPVVPSTDSAGSTGATDTTQPHTVNDGHGHTAAEASGLNTEFMRRFGALQKAVRDAGGDLTIFSGARDATKQAQLYQDAIRKYGSEQAARKWVAPPGKSNHDPQAGLIKGLGGGALAADLRGDLALAHKLAPQFGLMFPLANEAWHIELAGIRNK